MKARAGTKNATLLKSFLRVVRVRPERERRRSNSGPVVESSSIPRLGRLDSSPF